MLEAVRKRREAALRLPETARRIREMVEGADREAVPPDLSRNQLVEGRIYQFLEDIRYASADEALADEIHSVGATPEECVHALAKAKHWGKVERIEVLEGGEPRYTWGFRFIAGPTGFKAAGWKLPGGYVCTWWK